MTRRLLQTLCLGGALLAMLCLPALAQDDVVRSGIDIWSTPGDGLTFSNFAIEPIPAGFFCEGSEPFTGKIRFRGVPVKTLPAGALGDADTVIERLDDAPFDETGTAFTRVRFAAMQMESVEPVETDCGFFSVSVALTGEQPVTTMRITRLDKSGGIMDTVLAGEVNLTFTPIDRDDLEPRVFAQSFRFSPARGAWSGQQRVGFRMQSSVALDSDGDGVVDREGLGLSNFSAGSGRTFSAFFRTETITAPGINTPIPQPDCHCAVGQGGFEGIVTCLDEPDPDTGCLHLHCPEPVIGIGPVVRQPATGIEGASGASTGTNN